MTDRQSSGKLQIGKHRALVAWESGRVHKIAETPRFFENAAPITREMSPMQCRTYAMERLLSCGSASYMLRDIHGQNVCYLQRLDDANARSVAQRHNTVVINSETGDIKFH